jgi:predicted transcriptional regulator
VALSAFADTWHEIQAGGETTPKLAFGSRRELFSAITEKRLELLRHVASHEGLNVRQLARSLGRDDKNVHTDVTDLAALELLDRAGDGALLAPCWRPVGALRRDPDPCRHPRRGLRLPAFNRMGDC